MHIALCDDNVADRKQSERLLGRESDARLHTTGVLYLDSFGNSETLLRAPMQYDLFILDMTGEGPNGLELAQMLRDAGVTAPIALCCSTLDYQAMGQPPDGILFLQKPLRPEDIRGCIDQALSIRSSLAKTYEIRCEQETHYISADHVVTVSPDGHLARIVFADGSELKMLGTLEEFYYLTQASGKFLFARKSLLVNRDFIDSFSMRILRLTSGQTFPLSFSDWRFLSKHCPEKKKNTRNASAPS